MKKLELFFPKLLKDTYVIHSTGGFHPFRFVEDAAPIFKEDCWPYVQRIHWPEVSDHASKWRQAQEKPKQINLNISFRHLYPFHSFSEEEKREIKLKKSKSRITHKARYIKMHSAVARAFIPNPENKPQVCHINDDPSDYRVENLKWGTNQENHTGRRGDTQSKKDYSLIHSIFKMNGWAKGEK
jgi:hypothetical protein